MTPKTVQTDDSFPTVTPFSQAILDAMPANAAVLDNGGAIVAFNQGWRQFAIEHGDPELRTSGIGVNYLQTTGCTCCPSADEAKSADVGIRSVLAGDARSFSVEYASRQRWFQVQVTLLQGTDPRMALVLHTDITERKKAELALQANERRYRALTENSPDGILLLSADGSVLPGASAGTLTTGYGIDENAGKSIFDYVHPDDVPRLQGLLADKPAREQIRCRYLHKDGSWRWLEAMGTNLLADPAVQAIVINYRDITERKQTEEALREKEQRFRLIIEGLKDHAIFMLDRLGNVVTWNVGAERILGYTAQEIQGRHYSFCFPAEDTANGAPQRGLAKAAADGSFHEEGWRMRKDGGRFWSEGVLAAVYADNGEPRGFVTIAQDITERRRLRELFQSVFDHSADAVVTCDAQGAILLFNRAAEKLFGYAEAEVVGQNVRILMPEPHRTQHDRYIADYLRTGQAKVLGIGRDIEALRKDGARIPARLDVSEFYLNGERHFIGIVRDITEQRRIQENLQRLAAIVESSDDAIVGMSLQGTIHTWNPAAELLYGYSAAEAIGRSFTMVVLEERIKSLHERIARIARGEHDPPYETVRVRKGGKRIDVFARFSPIKGSDNAIIGASAIARDISERKKLEAQLRLSQKLDALGQLAGGVAHDFNNLLTVISGFSEIVTSKLAANDPNRELIQQVRLASERAAGLTRQLLAFTRQTVLEPRVLDLNTVIADTEKMLKRLIGEDVILTTTLDPAIRPVLIDPGQIEQVILNLAVNARDAMPQGGNLTIETGNVDLDEVFAAERPEVRPGPYVMLAMTDNGKGMTPEVKARVFEPFFTTKELGKGTGLGLATVYGIVKQSGGYIYIHSEPGQGSTFRIYLPIAQEVVSDRKPVHASDVPRGSETILLVEDEDDVRTMTRLVLQQFGFTVIEAHRGAEAIQLCAQHTGPIHLLITDVVMPEMGGRQLAERVTQMRPGIKVLYLSGYTDDAVVRHGVLQAEVAFLQKPFSMAGLGNKVREVLGSASK